MSLSLKMSLCEGHRLAKKPVHDDIYIAWYDRPASPALEATNYCLLMSALVILNILTPSCLKRKDEGKRILQEWVLRSSHYAPERYGSYEPIRLSFDPLNIDAALAEWDFSFLVTRRKPRMLGTVFMGNSRGTTHGWINIACEYKPELFSELMQFFVKVSVDFETDFAFMHLVPARHELTITTHQLRQGIPDLSWLTVFGTPYVSLFGRERIRSSPNAFIEELAHDLFSLRLSDDIRDVGNKPEEFFSRAQEIKRHLNNNAFFENDLALDYVYTVPTFQIQP